MNEKLLRNVQDNILDYSNMLKDIVDDNGLKERKLSVRFSDYYNDIPTVYDVLSLITAKKEMFTKKEALKIAIGLLVFNANYYQILNMTITDLDNYLLEFEPNYVLLKPVYVSIYKAILDKGGDFNA